MTPTPASGADESEPSDEMVLTRTVRLERGLVWRLWTEHVTLQRGGGHTDSLIRSVQSTRDQAERCASSCALQTTRSIST